jgi:hypothetical protein
MSFLDQLPEWNAPTMKIHTPTPKKQEEGWNIDERPPAGYFNWFWTTVSDALRILDTHNHDYKYVIRGEDNVISSEMIQKNIINEEHFRENIDFKQFIPEIDSHQHDNYLQKDGDTMSGPLRLGDNSTLVKETPNGDHIIIDENGRVWNSVYNDIAELYEADPKVKEGQVLIWDGEKVRTTFKAEDERVIGVYSNTFGYCLGGQPTTINKVPIGISGKVKTKVKGPVRPGDLLTTSEIPGVAKKSENKKLGTIFGKAMEDIEKDKIKTIWVFIAVI